MVWLIRNKYAWCMYRFILILKPRRVHWLRIFNRKHMVDGSNAFFTALPFPIRSLFLHRMCCASTMNHSMQMYSLTHTHTNTDFWLILEQLPKKQNKPWKRFQRKKIKCVANHAAIPSWSAWNIQEYVPYARHRVFSEPSNRTKAKEQNKRATKKTVMQKKIFPVEYLYIYDNSANTHIFVWLWLSRAGRDRVCCVCCSLPVCRICGHILCDANGPWS